MWLTLVGIVEVVAIIWVAALFLAARDRARRSTSSAVTACLADVFAVSPPTPLWKRVLFIPLAVVILPPTLLVLFVLSAPFAVILLGSHGFFWLRFKLFGTPMPHLGPPEESAADT